MSEHYYLYGSIMLFILSLKGVKLLFIRKCLRTRRHHRTQTDKDFLFE